MEGNINGAKFWLGRFVSGAYFDEPTIFAIVGGLYTYDQSYNITKKKHTIIIKSIKISKAYFCYMKNYQGLHKILKTIIRDGMFKIRGDRFVIIILICILYTKY